MKFTERPLTGKQEAFVVAYLGASNYNATQAARMAGYAGTDDTLASVGKQNLRKLPIRRAITAKQTMVQERSKVTPEFVLGRLVDLAFTTERDSDQMRALELIGKHLGMFQDKSVHHVGQFRIEVVRLEDPRVAPAIEGTAVDVGTLPEGGDSQD
jgi:hypothetical protein